MANTINESAIKKLMLVITVVDRAKAEFYIDVLGRFDVNVQVPEQQQARQGGLTMITNNHEVIFAIVNAGYAEDESK